MKEAAHKTGSKKVPDTVFQWSAPSGVKWTGLTSSNDVWQCAWSTGNQKDHSALASRVFIWALSHTLGQSPTWLTLVFTLQRLSYYHTAKDHTINHISRDHPGGPRFPGKQIHFIKQDIPRFRGYLPEAQSKGQTSNNYMVSVYLILIWMMHF